MLKKVLTLIIPVGVLILNFSVEFVTSGETSSRVTATPSIEEKHPHYFQPTTSTFQHPYNLSVPEESQKPFSTDIDVNADLDEIGDARN